MDKTEKKRIIKLRTSQGLAKRIDFPKDFNDLIEKAQAFLPINEAVKKYQFIDENVDREIRHQEDFELLAKHVSDKGTKILVNIIDKELDEIPISNAFSHANLDEESINLTISPIENKEEDDGDDKIKKDIKQMVRNKMKSLENDIIQDIYKSIKTQLETNEEKINALNIKQDEVIHKGIKCNICGTENIKGIRYRCLQCQHFNLCSNCEKKNIHEADHILIKIRKALDEESELLFNMNRDLKYKNKEYNYMVEQKEIKFGKNTKENDTLVQQITLKNNGNEPWKSGAYFKCLSNSQITGKDFKISCKVNKDATVNIELIFDDIKNKVEPSTDEYFVYYQMFNANDEAFGNITKFRIFFQD
jgi:hypothetical protein